LKSDLNNFDKILLSNALIDVVISRGYEMLETDHMQVLYVCCADPTEFQSSHQAESWFKVFQKMKDYLLVSICDPELCDQGLFILHNFLTADTLKFQIYDDCRDIYSKSLELLYHGESDICKQKFKDYILSRVVKQVGSGEGTPSSGDNTLRKFYKGLLQKFSEDQPTLYASSNLTSLPAML
jgi:hypothetical protein